MKNCRLVAASISDKTNKRIFEMLQNIGRSENGFDNPAFGLSLKEYEAFIDKTIDSEDSTKIKPDRVPQTTFWLYDGQEVIGFSKMRHYLNDGLRIKGGHIGYGIRQDKRGEGYGTALLKLTLDEINRRGVKKVLITCDADNRGSRNVIEANGGILDKIVDDHCSYWIQL